MRQKKIDDYRSYSCITSNAKLLYIPMWTSIFITWKDLQVLIKFENIAVLCMFLT